jgi:hypothetical protein
MGSQRIGKPEIRAAVNEALCAKRTATAAKAAADEKAAIALALIVANYGPLSRGDVLVADEGAVNGADKIERKVDVAALLSQVSLADALAAGLVEIKEITIEKKHPSLVTITRTPGSPRFVPVDPAYEVAKSA